jgi:carbonic anhydrase
MNQRQRRQNAGDHRMNTLKTATLIGALGCALVFAPRLQAAPKNDPSTRLLRDASLMLLKEGNARFVAGKPQHPHLDAERRSSTAAQGQEPFATILACSDSRDPVELIFDRGIGDLFVVRVAGNVAGISELATVEYGVGHLNTPLLIVMGHTKCGAVTAVVKGAELHGHLHALAEKIQPAADKVKVETTDVQEAVPKAIQANVWQTIEDIIRLSAIVREKIESGQVSIVGAIYDLEQGKVNWLGAHPAQDALIALASQAATDSALVAKPAHAEKPAAKPALHSKPSPPRSVAKTDDHADSPHSGPAKSSGTKQH